HTVPETGEFTLEEETEVRAGFFTAGGGSAIIGMDANNSGTGNSRTDHDLSPAPPATTGDPVNGFSNANLRRTYAFEINILSTIDSDGDGIRDNWEIAYFNNLSATDGSGDADNDGASDYDEYENGTNPVEEDTDGDGLKDGAETNTGIFIDAEDTGTDPLNTDSDNDGSADGVEVTKGTDPNTANSITELNTISVLPTGTYDMIAGADFINAYVENDGTHSWLLVGRGREGWTWDANGQGAIADVSDLATLGKPSAFAPATYSTALINALLGASGADLTGVEIRLKRASNPEGSAYEEGRWRPKTETAWRWNFDTGMEVQYEVVETNGAPGGQLGQSDRNTRDGELAGNDSDRVFTWNWDQHQTMGFSMGQNVRLGSNSATNFWYERANEDHAIPYAEIYIRLEDPDSPELTDSDNDGIGDVIENALAGNLDDLSAGDDDGDGLNSPDELNTHGTDPLDADSDDDGLNDGDEITAGVDPNNADSDGDGLADGAEVATHGTDPAVADTDGDGASDGIEIQVGTDPLDDASVPPTLLVQPSFPVTLLDVPAGADVAPNEQVAGLTYREDHHPGGVLAHNNSQQNWNRIILDPANWPPLRSVTAIQPWFDHGNGGFNTPGGGNRPWTDGGGDHFCVLIEGYVLLEPGAYTIHLGADDTNYFVIDTPAGAGQTAHNCCPNDHQFSFNVPVKAWCPFANLMVEEGGGDWGDVSISGPGFGRVGLGDT
ncbi:MAG: hypothetical protein VCA55_04330, partial [Verrucomicrobiales bacterium]